MDINDSKFSVLMQYLYLPLEITFVTQTLEHLVLAIVADKKASGSPGKIVRRDRTSCDPAVTGSTQHLKVSESPVAKVKKLHGEGSNVITGASGN
ncbi:hypothetical protein BaRGS_00035579 [Batillaria attramentaria]|uniref:Uncharacterized protein n=1 Tax=Batillaria attramentaria TaxID=370345 RepID=A0ABD0JDZ3_9CAEN